MLVTQIITEKQQMQRMISPVWALLNTNYGNVKGGLLFQSQQHLIASTAVWKVVSLGNKVIAVTIYKAKHGLKLVAMSICQKLKIFARPALINLIKQDLTHCWMELSEAAEHFVMKYCQGDRYIINNCIIHKLLNKPFECSDKDSFHYSRVIQGTLKEKIIVGTPKIDINATSI